MTMKDDSANLRIGSRGSELAMWQARWVKGELEKQFPDLKTEIIVIKTTGDKILDSPLSKIGDKGLFIKEIERSLLDGSIDLAVHSLKDMPTTMPDGLTLGAVTRRDDVRDVFISHPDKSYKKFTDLPPGAKVATGSVRRKCQLMRWRPDLEIVEIRGNLNTRLKKLDESSWDGMILARAGMMRLGLENRITEILPIERVLPAVGQGTLALEIRTNDEKMKKVAGTLNDPSTEIGIKGERALLHELEGGCQVPMGAYGRIENGVFVLEAMIGTVDGKKVVRGKIHGAPEQAEHVSQRLAQTLLHSGGEDILDRVRSGMNVEVPAI